MGHYEVDLRLVDIRLAIKDEDELHRYGKDAVFIQCLEARHSDSQRSMAVYDGHIHCFGCGHHIKRRMESLAYLLNAPLQEVFKTAVDYIPTQPITEKPKRVVDIVPAHARLFNSILNTCRSHRKEWLYQRGLTDETIARFQLGHDGGHFVIPVFAADGSLATLRYRRDDAYDTEAPKYWGTRGCNEPRLFPAHIIAQQQPTSLAVVEGEFDTMLLWQQGIPAVTCTNGAQSIEHLPPLLSSISSLKHLWCIGDMDGVGLRAMDQFQQSVPYATTRVRWPLVLGKDVTDLSGYHEIEDFELRLTLDNDRMTFALDTIHGRMAARAYAYSVAPTDEELAKEILRLIGEQE